MNTLVLISRKRSLSMYGYVIQLPTHMSARCASWNNDLMSDIVWEWPESHQERNSLIPHRHEHDNLWDLWQSQPSALICNVRRKALCYHNHGNELWVRMCNIPRSFNTGVTLFRQWEVEALAATQSTIPTSKWRPLFIIEFLWYLYLLLLYIKSSSFL